MSTIKSNLRQKENFKLTKNSILQFPILCFPIESDGNCFFRAISLCITGTEVQHQKVRKEIENT